MVAPIKITGPRPIFKPLAAPTPSAESSPAFVARVLNGGAAPQADAGTPSLFEQLSDVVTGLPSGLAGMAIDAGRDVQGIGRTIKDAAAGDLGNNASDYFPLLTGFQHSVARTVGRIGNLAAAMAPGSVGFGQSEYGKAITQGHIVPTLLEDAGNAALIGSLAAKGLTAGASAATKGMLAEDAAAHPLTQAAALAERVTHPLNEVAAAPARVWTAPVKAVTGFDLPPRLFGTTEEGAARRVGLVPALKDSGVLDRLQQTPAVSSALDALSDYRAKRAQVRDVRENVLLPAQAEVQTDATTLSQRLTPALDVLREGTSKDAAAELEHANHLIHAGLAPTVNAVLNVKDAVQRGDAPPAAFDDVMGRTFGIENAPSVSTLETVRNYTAGKLDPAVRDRLDRAWGIEHRALTDLEARRLEGTGRIFGGLAEEQTGTAPIPYKVEAEMAPLHEQRQALADAIHGTDTAPGLTERLAAARQAIPTAEPSELVSRAASIKTRRAGALTGAQDAALSAAERYDTAAGRASERVAQAADAAAQAEADLKARPDLNQRQAEQYVRSVRGRVRDQMRDLRSTLEAKYADHLPIKIPARNSPEWDIFQALQNELASSSGTSATRANFRNMTTDMRDAATGRPIPFFAKGHGQPIDRVRDLIHGGDEEAFAADVRTMAEMRQAEGAVIRDGLPRGQAQGFAADPMEHAALMGEVRPAAGEVIGAHRDWVSQEPKATTAPWRALGRAEGTERVFSTEAERADARALNLESKINAAEERAQAAEAAGTGKARSFGERVGKATRDAQRIERELNRKVKKLAWLDDEKIPAEEARLAAGPVEVAPGRYVPALAHGQRAVIAIRQMGRDLAEQTGDPSMAARFEAMTSDVPQTMDQLHLLTGGTGPDYLPGAGQTRGVAMVRGDRLPFTAATASERAKSYGHVPPDIRSVQRAATRDLADTARNNAAGVLSQRFAKTGADIIGLAVEAGDVAEHTGRALLERRTDRRIDFAAEAHRQGFTPWDPTAHDGRVAPGTIGPETLFIPTPIAEAFRAWFKPASNNPLLRVYDKATTGFKHSVLALSPQWNLNNIVGNSVMATFGAGETPMALWRQVPELKRRLEIEAAGGELATPPRLRSAGQPGEIARLTADAREPRTPLGRLIQSSYALNGFVDNYARSLVYLAKIEKGYTSEAAVKASLDALGDFTNLSPLERDVVRRVIPFYAWSKHIARASAHLALEHPWRVATLLHLSDMFSDPNDKNLPDWLRGGINLGGLGYITTGALNPYSGNAFSPLTAPSDWPGELGRGINPLIKLGTEAATGLNLDKGRTATGSPGSGHHDDLGNRIFGPESPGDVLYQAARILPQTRFLTDLAQDPVVRYDTGEPIFRNGVTIPLTGGRLHTALGDLGLPLFPRALNADELAARAKKQRAANERARAKYASH
ncbi:MAG: hypothetical protein QOJ67_2520 [Acidimicrobiaceae bacterium]